MSECVLKTPLRIKQIGKIFITSQFHLVFGCSACDAITHKDFQELLGHLSSEHDIQVLYEAEEKFVIKDEITENCDENPSAQPLGMERDQCVESVEGSENFLVVEVTFDSETKESSEQSDKPKVFNENSSDNNLPYDENETDEESRAECQGSYLQGKPKDFEFFEIREMEEELTAQLGTYGNLKTMQEPVDKTSIMVINLHKENNSSEKTNTTFETGNSFRSKDSISSKTKGESINYNCEQCGLLFANRAKLEEHIECLCHWYYHLRRNPSGVAYSCLQCTKRCLTRFEVAVNEGQHNEEILTKHIGSRHQNHVSKTHVCHMCGMAYKTASTLYGHMRIHSYDEETATLPKELVREMKIDHNKGEYTCKICVQNFHMLPGLYSHMKTHMVTSSSKRHYPWTKKAED